MHGKGMNFEFECMTCTLLDAFQLSSIACTEGGVSLSCAIDGAQLHNGTVHVTAGVKTMGKQGHDSNTGALLSISGLDEEEVAAAWIFYKMQSRENCGMMKILFAAETKAIYQEAFADFFNFVGLLDKEGWPASEYSPSLKPFEVTVPQDLCSAWKSLGVGGAAKVLHFFCQQGAHTSDTITS